MFSEKMHKIIIFFQKKKIIRIKYVCLPYLKFSDTLPETHLFFYFGLMVVSECKRSVRKPYRDWENPVFAVFISGLAGEQESTDRTQQTGRSHRVVVDKQFTL